MLLILGGCLHGQRVAAFEVMLPEVYEDDVDIAGWLVSEKFDGVRGYWNGRTLLSKNGRPFYPPVEFFRNFPEFALEGEIWGGRGTFERTVGAVKHQKAHNGWLDLKFAIFDVPDAGGGFVQRLDKAKEWFSKNPSDFAFVIPQKTVQNKEELQEELLRVEHLGGEGLIVRRPDALYSKGRTGNILKVKSYQDMEARVVGHVPGTGKNQGKLGSLLVELSNGTRFKIGTGFTDAERTTPPPVGVLITFKYYGLYQSGIPKFPSFLRIRADNGL
ncbi:MAG: DNA ligase [Proteobacteria bacterium]|nr:DNA ligase [Pseudomonadota bacterium]MBU1708740.1 DNA ligase [Pseudomonadota bacterium]